MKKRNPNRISELRLRRRWSQSELAERVGAHWVTISKLERGLMKLTQDWMKRLGEALEVSPTEFMSDPPTIRTIYVHGFIDDGGKVVKDSIIGEGGEITAVSFDVEIGSLDPDKTVWYMLGTEAFSPFMGASDLVRFTYQDQFSIEKVLRKICLIETDEEDSKRIVGVISRGSKPNLVDINTYHGAPILDVAVREIATMTMIIIDPEFQKDEDGYPLP